MVTTVAPLILLLRLPGRMDMVTGPASRNPASLDDSLGDSIWSSVTNDDTSYTASSDIKLVYLDMCSFLSPSVWSSSLEHLLQH